MKALRTLKIVSIALGVVIVVLVGVLISGPSAEGPTKAPAPTGTAHQTAFSPDGSIGVTMPAPGAIVTSPAGIEGQAIGSWFFEATFPIAILDGDGTVLGQGAAQALGDWMTTGTVAFAAPKYATGTIVFRSDNPSGNPANGKEFDFMIRFK